MQNKFKTGFVTGYKIEKEEAERQEKLRKNNGIEDENIVVVEKSNMTKFIIKTATAIITKVAQCLIFILAIIGLMTLIYPETRDTFLLIVNNTISEIVKLIK